MNYTSEKDLQIIKYVTDKKQRNDEGAVFAVDKLQWMTRKIIEQNIRAYDSIFVEPYMTNGESKMFMPLTAMTVKQLASKMDFDVKDIKITPKTEEGKGTALLLRSKLHYELDRQEFGAIINESTFEFLKQGTILMRTYESDGVPRTDIVDLNNIWTQWNTNKPSFYLERIYLEKANLPESFKYPDESKVSETFDRLGITSDYIDTWRYEGFYPLSLITGNKDDKKMVRGVVWITNLLTNPIVQDIYLQKESSYSYAQIEPRSYRWLGKGIAESLMDLQEYENEVVNLRRQRGRLATLGAHVIRKGSGITPDMVQNLVTGSGLLVNDINKDIKRLEIGDVPASSFNEESRIQQMADRYSGSNEVSRGEAKSIQTATEAEILKLTSDSMFALYVEQFSFVLKDVIKKWLKIIGKNMKQEEIVALTANFEERKQIARGLAKLHVRNRMEEIVNSRGLASISGFTEQDIEDMVAKMSTKYMSKEHFKLLKDSVKNLEYDIAVDLSNESDLSVSKGENLNKLLELIGKGFVTDINANEIALDMLESYGLNSMRYKKSTNMVNSQQ